MIRGGGAGIVWSGVNVIPGGSGHSGESVVVLIELNKLCSVVNKLMTCLIIWTSKLWSFGRQKFGREDVRILGLNVLNT